MPDTGLRPLHIHLCIYSQSHIYAQKNFRETPQTLLKNNNKKSTQTPSGYTCNSSTEEGKKEDLWRSLDNHPGLIGKFQVKERLCLKKGGP